MNSSIPKYGYVPVSFPRDPIAVNQFIEHIVLGQIFTPLIQTDAAGNLKPGVAKSWSFSEDRTAITFDIDNRYKFDDGREITAEDVRYSILRHLEGKSQSKNFLKGISEIRAKEKYKVEVVLTEPNSAIIKALSRDQLGIIPSGWKFDPTSSKPYVCSGAYCLVKKRADWFLTKNVNYPNASSVTVPEWRLIFFSTEKYELPANDIPDVTLFMTDDMVKEFNAKFPEYQKLYGVEPIPSFTQSSAWYYPHGKHYSSVEHKRKTMALMERLIAISTEAKGYERATGVIPKGISGHLFEKPKVSTEVLPKNQELKVALVGGFYDFLFDSEESRELLEELNVKIERIYVAGPSLGEMVGKKPDVIIAAWAGGFSDPDGFLPILSSILQVESGSYLGSISRAYYTARAEGDWSRRSDLFRELNRVLVEEQFMVPGWKLPTYAISKQGFANTQQDFRYTPRLATVISE